ncbi:MAG: methyltransferase domain-containing protein [Firmicutes bacterium]|nr:methyltransferase domain-containing protein [Bacillota bacterium]
MNPIISACHLHVAAVLKLGDSAVDATAGNGNDTLFLARLVGKQGVVHSFDIQQQAIDNTQALLHAHSLESQVRLHKQSHTEMSKYLMPGTVGAVLFNLGYLPRGDKTLVTKPETTVIALNASISLLRPGGLVAIVTYSGHSGGEVEEQKVAEFCGALSSRDFSVLKLELINKPNSPPRLWLIYKAVK